MNESGYIKLHRSLLDWEWHDEPSMMTVFIHCLLMANWTEGKYHGEVIERGSFATSYEHLAQVTGLARSTIYKIVHRLSETGEIEVIRKQSYTIIRVRNYAVFQQSEEDSGNTAWKNQKHSVNTERTQSEPIEEYKNTRNKKVLKKTNKRKRREEILPEYWNPNPIRVENPIQATPEEIESVKAKLRGETKGDGEDTFILNKDNKCA